MVKTRKEYMDGRQGQTREEHAAGHRAWYAQFVTPSMVESVARQIGHDALRNSTDEHMNDIALRNWDNLYLNLPIADLRNTGEGNSMATKVCIAKEAARQWCAQ